MPRLLLAVALACVGMVWLLKSDAGAVDLHVGTGRALLAGNNKLQTSFAFSPISSFDGYVNSGGGLNLTSFYRIEAETCWTQVRVWIFSQETVQATGWSVIVGPTETGLYDTLDDQYSPTLGGTAYNSFAASSSAPGWQTATFAGSATGTLPARTSPQIPGVLVSDWQTVPCYPRVDGSVHPALLVRAHHDGSVNGVYSAIGILNGQPWSSGANNLWYRLFNTATQVGDFVGTLTPLPPVNYGYTNNFPFFLGVEFKSATPTRSFMVCGNSITAGAAGQSATFGNWGVQAVLSSSRPSHPKSIFVAGSAGQNSANYFANCANLINNYGLRPSDIVYSSWTPNDTFTNAATDTRIANLQTQIASARSTGTKLIWLWDGLGSSTFNTTEQAVLNYSNGLSDALVANGTANGNFNFNGALCDNSNPQVCIDLQADGIHPNQAGEIILAGVMLSGIEPSTYPPELIAQPSLFPDDPQLGNIASLIQTKIAANPAASADTFQWLRDGSNIGGATSQIYRLASGDVGHVISTAETVTVQGNTNTYTTPTTATIVTNPISPSDDISGWTFTTGDSAIANAATDPLGGSTASTFIEGALTSAHFGSTPANLTIVSGKTYKFVAYVAKTNRQYIQIGPHATSAFSSNCYANFDLTAGKRATLGSNAIGSGIFPAPIGTGNTTWGYEISVECVATGSSSVQDFFIAAIPASGSGRLVSFAGAAQIDYAVWGVRLYKVN